ncbi:AEC family transporter [Halomicrobium urmianum]|uniref:AEC family transporter n=1 Tax=Halomicrobium urmianum TaxID=1586233 RepID=UPI001CD94CEB|nr:AEC family transporter [Halomicrobium urmianum]
MSLLSIFASSILPVVAMAATGYALARITDVEADALNTVTVYVLAPALVVHSLTTSALGGGTIVRVVGVVGAFTLAMLVVSEGFGRLSGRSEPLLGAFVLVTIFPNTGNYGIPLADFAFGPEGRSTAVLVTALQGVMLYTLGIYVAARGGEGDALSSMRRVFSVPLVYAVVVALAARWLGLVPPTEGTLMSTLELLGNASIPIMLLILGIQLANADVSGALRPVAGASAMRLLIAPVVALAVTLGTASLIGFENQVVARVVVLLLGTPTGVTPIILVGAFSSIGADDGLSPSAFVSATVLVTTVASVVTVTALVALLQSGAVL